jgi:hypothetical protein
MAFILLVKYLFNFWKYLHQGIYWCIFYYFFKIIHIIFIYIIVKLYNIIYF